MFLKYQLIIIIRRCIAENNAYLFLFRFLIVYTSLCENELLKCNIIYYDVDKNVLLLASEYKNK
jgi:hypothetical protein